MIGELGPVQARTARPGVGNRELTHGHKPFELPVFSACLRTHRATELRRVMALLLDHGASLPGAELLTFALSFNDLETVARAARARRPHPGGPRAARRATVRAATPPSPSC